MFLGARRALAMRDPRSPIVQLFADGTDGFYFDFSKTDRTFQDQAGTLADDDTESIGLALESSKWSGASYATALAASRELMSNGDFASNDLTGYTNLSVGAHTLDASSGSASMAGTDASNRAWVQQAIGGLIVGAHYRLACTAARTSGQIVMAAGASSGNSAWGSRTIGASGVIELDVIATATTGYVHWRTQTTGGVFTVDDISFKRIPGNHGLQTTSLARPTRQANGIARFDGTDDNLLTTLVPGTAMTLMARFKASNSSIILGTSDGSGRAYLSLETNGLVSGGVGSQSNATIKGGSDVRGTTGVGVLVYDASNVTLYWNGSVIYGPSAKAGTLPASAVLLGSLPSSSFMNGDLYHALAIKKALSSSQIQAITTLWGTT